MNIVSSAALTAALVLSLCACQPRQEQAGAPETAADASTDPPAPQAEAGGNFRCDELLVSARPEAGGERLTLSLSGHRLTLARQAAAADVSYADDQGNAFRRDGDQATVTLDDEPPRTCTATDQVSPWDEAAERSIGFRAIGQEPGWLLELGSGDRPALSAQLDYGARTLEVGQVERKPGASGFEGETADGTTVVLEIERSACADPMSGERFEATARLRVDEQVYEGCGAFLGD